MQSYQCLICKHYIGVGYCAAFEDGIPAEIMTGKFDHHKAYEGDQGIRFELDEVFGFMLDGDEELG
ncbi:MAG: hypothetical protein OQJ95_11870 [Kangiella sp.]|jgi:hypothetical protein|nr:hypothetical protein [Kangiella sp.]